MTILQQTREALRLRHDADTTERTDLDGIEQFIRFHKGPAGWKHPKDLGAPEVERFLTVERPAAASTRNQAFNASGVRPKSVLGRDLYKSTLFDLTTLFLTLYFRRVRPRVTE
jgi:integrase